MPLTGCTMLGVPTEDMVALFDDEARIEQAAAAYRLAAKLTADPHLITDADIARVRDNFSDAKRRKSCT